MSLSHYVHVPLHFVYLVPLCPCPIMSLSRFAPFPFCPSSIASFDSFLFCPSSIASFDSFLFCPCRVLSQSHCDSCLSPVVFLSRFVPAIWRVLFQSYGEFCPSHMASFVPVTLAGFVPLTWRVLSQSRFVPFPCEFCPNPGVLLSRFVPVLLLVPVLFCFFSGRGLARLC